MYSNKFEADFSILIIKIIITVFDKWTNVTYLYNLGSYITPSLMQQRLNNDTSNDIGKLINIGISLGWLIHFLLSNQCVSVNIFY